VGDTIATATIKNHDGSIFSLNNNNFWFNPALLGRGYSETQRQKFCTLVHSAVALFLPNSTDRLPLPS
jgi:hypothetical protein